MSTQRIYVISFAPSYDESSIGGYEYRRSWEDALLALNSIAKLDPGEQDVGSDFRIITLDLPGDMDAGEIVDFLSSSHGAGLIDPPDPREDLADALYDWREAGKTV